MSGAAPTPSVPPAAEFPRREFLKAGGALIIGFSMRGLLAAEALAAQGTAAATRGAAAGPPDPKQIDTWLAIHSDNTATVYVGYVELGQGSTTSLLQIAAEELDLDMSQVSTIRLDTNITPESRRHVLKLVDRAREPGDSHRGGRGAPGAAAARVEETWRVR